MITGVRDRSSILSVDKNCLNNHQFDTSEISEPITADRTVGVSDDNYAQKKGVKYRVRIWLIRPISTINN